MKPDELIDGLNKLNPQCPVLLHTIQFTYNSFVDQIKQYELSLQDFMLPDSKKSFNEQQMNYLDLEDRRTYIFPACGHVFGYSKNLEGR